METKLPEELSVNVARKASLADIVKKAGPAVAGRGQPEQLRHRGDGAIVNPSASDFMAAS